ncbi:MAG: SulP family inorganic anion transporter, partial [Mesorhizobium sp.]
MDRAKTATGVKLASWLPMRALSGWSGFFTFVAGSVAFALLGANRQLSAGADSTITPLFAGGLALIATSGSPHYLALAAMLALMAGLLVALSGVFRLGW